MYQIQLQLIYLIIFYCIYSVHMVYVIDSNLINIFKCKNVSPKHKERSPEHKYGLECLPNLFR